MIIEIGITDKEFKALAECTKNLDDLKRKLKEDVVNPEFNDVQVDIWCLNEKEQFVFKY